MKKNGLLMKAMPLLLIIIGFFTLDMFQGFIALTCMVIGIVMIIERIWPERWGDESVNNNTAEKQQL